MNFKKIGSLVLSGLMTMTLLAGCGSKQAAPTSAGKGDAQNLKGKNLVVYVSFHEDEAKALLDDFKEKTGCNYSFIRMPTGEAITRIVAEKDAPKADILIGGTADAHELMKQKDLNDKYVSENAKDIPVEYRDKDGHWTGLYVEPLSIGINEDRWEKEFAPKGLKRPETFEDLLKPEFKGEIIMPDPKTSGTGYTIVSSLVQARGEEKAMEYLGKLKNNVAQFTGSGFTPAQKVGTGEYLICLNFMDDQLIVKKSGFNISSRIPNEAGWTICSLSKLKNGPNDEAGKAFVDYCLTKEAGDILGDFSMAISTRADVKIPEGGQKLSELPIFKAFDFNKSGKDKKDLQGKWSKLK
ncbi:ABC transporter substrate-binding protein [Clostridium ganghwense]|uniref:ABC transporter substrate-binding protein n=1 Tax=Clostridium ganghwense TaxID=312089 RepID=A0ABT4CJR8_9CLOT|nr:ABC transporter substrate-binding protein [Clostridium ganghwense]MCY6369291.1 ABC transporter substrate-binding protein [Clostridium ganghwense]